MMHSRRVSIIVPTFNESASIVALVSEILEILPDRAKEILVVDDNSPDGTAALVRDAFAGNDSVKVIVRTSDRGLANSIRTGIEACAGDDIVVMDSDFNHQPKYLPILVDLLVHYECVSGSRFVYGGLMNNRFRHLMSWTFNIFVRLVTGGLVSDSLYGFIAIRRERLFRCDFDLIFWGYGDYCIRLMYYLQQQGTAILQIPTVNGKRRGGTGNSAFFSTLWQYTVATLKLAARERCRRRWQEP